VRSGNCGQCRVSPTRGGAFYAGNALVRPQPRTQPTATAILEEAKNRVPPPVLPPKPGGHEVVELVDKKLDVETPVVRMVTKDIGIFGVKIQVPVQETQHSTIITKVPQTKLVDASPQEIDVWNKQVKSLQEQYEANLRYEIDKIVQEERQNNDKEIIEMTKDVVKNVVAPLLASLAGLITALTVLFRGYAPTRRRAGRHNSRESA
jgi:hypothetical protein